MKKLITMLILISTFLFGQNNGILFRTISGAGYNSSINDKISGVGYHIGGRLLLNVDPSHRYGLETTFVSPFGNDDNNYIAIGIVLEQIKKEWFLMSIGTIGYIELGNGGNNPFGIVSDLGWESPKEKKIKPFVSYRSEWIFNQSVLSLNSISFGILF